MKFTIRLAEELIKASKGKLSLGVLVSQVRVSKGTPALDTYMDECINGLRASQLTGAQIETMPQVSALNETYAALGKDIKKFKGSNESLLKRIVEGNGIYRINTVVDINNAESLNARRSFGSYDLAKLGTNITFSKGQKGQKYVGTSNRSVDLENLPVLSDESGPFGSPTSDSQRALIKDDTQYLMTVIFSFDGPSSLGYQLSSLERLLSENAEAQNVQKMIITPQCPQAEFFFEGYDEMALLSESAPAIQFSPKPEQKNQSTENRDTPEKLKDRERSPSP